MCSDCTAAQQTHTHRDSRPTHRPRADQTEVEREVRGGGRRGGEVEVKEGEGAWEGYGTRWQVKDGRMERFRVERRTDGGEKRERWRGVHMERGGGKR